MIDLIFSDPGHSDLQELESPQREGPGSSCFVHTILRVQELTGERGIT